MSEIKKYNILLVDDRPENLLVLEKLLEGEDRNLVKATSGNEALGLTLEMEFALILLDVQMPDMDGFETAELIQGNAETADVPIIFVTAISKEQKHVSKGYACGAVDYIFKPLDPDILRAKVNILLEMHKQRDELQRQTEALTTTVAQLQKSRDQVEAQNKELEALTIRDSLTGLFNHRHLEYVLSHEFRRAERYERDICCLLLDLDFFKEVNDTHGHGFGDLVLKEFATLLDTNIRDSDMAFRYGGEEFLALLPQTDLFGGQQAAEKIRSYCQAKQFRKGDVAISVTVSIGLASLAEHNPQKPEDLIAYADKALYRAKAEGRNRVCVYEAAEAGTKGSDENRIDFQYLKDSVQAIMEKTRSASLSALELLVRDRGPAELRQQHRKVETYISRFGSKLKLSGAMVESLKRAASFHGTFNILLDEIKVSRGRKASVEELGKIREYPEIMAEFAELFDFFSQEKKVLLYHHENYDGSGYPKGLHGEEIPLAARIFALADALAAMTTNRPHRSKLPAKQVVDELVSKAGSQFDPQLASILLEIIAEDELLEVSADMLGDAKERI